MKKFTIIDILQGPKAKFYSVLLEGKRQSEFEEFLTNFRDNPEFSEIIQNIVIKIDQMARVTGAREIFFKPEGPSMVFRINIGRDETYPLRLYCLRYNDQVVLLGGGGYKDLSTVRYQDKEELNNAVKLLRAVDKSLKEEEASFTDLDLVSGKQFELKGL
ncbi:MAG TPA: hypothetical protein VHO03_01495 [Ignavibacteriales bacterium]|nr:hypothetical protein [Ignavibacteriales bacterium]